METIKFSSVSFHGKRFPGLGDNVEFTALLLPYILRTQNVARTSPTLEIFASMWIPPTIPSRGTFWKWTLPDRDIPWSRGISFLFTRIQILYMSFSLTSKFFISAFSRTFCLSIFMKPQNSTNFFIIINFLFCYNVSIFHGN